MTNEDLLRIERRMGGSLDAAALISEVRLAWRCMDQVVQARIDQEAVVESLRTRVAEMEARQTGRSVAQNAGLTKAQWVEMYGGQELLDAEGMTVVPCDPHTCQDSICHGWRVVRKEGAASVA